jgi:outer membrane protein OmpU
MKKSLLATTAMAALCAVAVAGPASAAEKIQLKVGGYMEQWFGYSDTTKSVSSTNDGFDQQSDGEIHFKGSTTLDNGLKVGVNVQLEAQGSGDQIDEQFAFVEGSFGKIILGSENSVAYLMHTGLPSQGVGIDSGDAFTWIPGIQLAEARTRIRGNDNDSEKFSYVSPRFQGFQIGASFVPELEQDNDNEPNDANGLRNNSFAVAANFKRSFNDFKLGASGAYQDFGEDDLAIGALDAYAVALQLGFAGFTATGNYKEEDVSVGSTQETIGLGVQYVGGPLGVSLAYIGSELDNNSQEQDSFELGASYKIGPGVQARGSVLVAEGTNAGGTKDADGFAVIGGLTLAF